MTNKIEFWTDESGAVTVDMTVLAAGVVGLGIATMSVVTVGVEDLSGDINTELTSNSWNMFGNGRLTLGSFDFSGGDAVGWLGGTVRDMGGELGELLVLGPGESTGFLVDVQEGVSEAVMQFDLVAGDSLDNSAQWGTDTAVVMLNGTPVAIALASGKSIPEALSWGPINSMSVVQYIGAQKGLLSREKLEKHLTQAPKENESSKQA